MVADATAKEAAKRSKAALELPIVITDMSQMKKSISMPKLSIPKVPQLNKQN